MTAVPFFRPEFTQAEIDEVVDTLRSGWLTTGPRVRQFETDFARAVHAEHAVAVNSCTAALHLAVEALGLKPGQGVLVPTMTFAASAEVVRYMGAVPILVDCDPETFNIDFEMAANQIRALRDGRLPETIPSDIDIAGVIPVHVGGRMLDLDQLQAFAAEHKLWVVEDAAHAFPAAWQRAPGRPWIHCGGGASEVTCFSFYANKTITTGEGGMAVTHNEELAERMRLMSLHGLSHDAWGRYTGEGTWDYSIVAPGFKYNMTDVAAALGIRQLERSRELRGQREAIAKRYFEAFQEVDEIRVPPPAVNRIHSWHLFPIALKTERLTIDRTGFLRELQEREIGFSVHWRPLHLHPYYADTWGWRDEHLPVASTIWTRLVTLPLFPAMRTEEIDQVIEAVRDICRDYRRTPAPSPASVEP